MIGHSGLVLSEIQSGSFPREFIADTSEGSVVFDALRKKRRDHALESVGARVRALMPWLAEG